MEAIRILANADRVYWLVYEARGELDVRQRQYELAQQQVDQAVERVAAGDVPRIEITRAESGRAARLEDILVADTVLRRRTRDLGRIMNRPDLPLDVPTEVVPTTPPNPLGLDLSAPTLADFAVANRMEMLESELRLALAGRTYEAERRQFELGRGTSTDVLDAADRLALAQSREVPVVLPRQAGLPFSTSRFSAFRSSAA